MHPTNDFRAELESVSPYLNEAVDHFLASIIGSWKVQHKDDDTHGAITADSIAVAGALSVTGATRVTGLITGTGGARLNTLSVGNTGSLFSVDTGGIPTERGRADAMGVWRDVPYLPGAFTGGGAMTWTVDAGDIAVLALSVIGKTMTISAELVTTSIGGAVNPELRWALPFGWTIARAFVAPGFAIKDSSVSGTHELVLVVGAAGGTYLSFYLLGAPNWPLTANTSFIYFNVTFSVS